MPMIRSRRCKALALLAVLGSSVVAVPALAACGITQGGFVPQDVQMDMGTVVILPSTPVGGVIREINVPINERRNVGDCGFHGGYVIGEYVNAAQRIPVAGFENVYQTGVAGVGIRVFQESGRAQWHYPYWRGRGGEWGAVVGWVTRVSVDAGQFRIQLIKTAAETGSGLIAPNGPFTTYYFDGDGPGRPLLTSTFQGSGTTVVSPTCEVEAGSRSIAVDFGSVPTTGFTAVGARAGNRDFDIRLNCQGSNLAQFQSRIGVRLDANQHDSRMPGVLKLGAAANAATGIGIEMVQRDGSSEREVHFGQTIHIGTTTVGSAALTLPLRARYVQTAAGPVGPGTASGQATFTIQYD